MLFVVYGLVEGDGVLIVVIIKGGVVVIEKVEVVVGAVSRSILV